MEEQTTHETQSQPGPNGNSGDGQELERLQQDLNDAQSQVLRAQAELDNFRKRMRREMEEERRFASSSLLRDLFPALDNLERAVGAAEQSAGSAGVVQGVRMVAQQLGEILQQHGCRRIPTIGENFDPHLHEALAQQPSDDKPAGAILVEARAGYQLHDRVLRPAQVIISSGPATKE
jgi:molecular chaperone GrpE